MYTYTRLTRRTKMLTPRTSGPICRIYNMARFAYVKRVLYAHAHTNLVIVEKWQMRTKGWRSYRITIPQNRRVRVKNKTVLEIIRGRNDGRRCRSHRRRGPISLWAPSRRERGFLQCHATLKVDVVVIIVMCVRIEFAKEYGIKKKKINVSRERPATRSHNHGIHTYVCTRTPYTYIRIRRTCTCVYPSRSAADYCRIVLYRMHACTYTCIIDARVVGGVVLAENNKKKKIANCIRVARSSSYAVRFAAAVVVGETRPRKYTRIKKFPDIGARRANGPESAVSSADIHSLAFSAVSRATFSGESTGKKKKHGLAAVFEFLLPENFTFVRPH